MLEFSPAALAICALLHVKCLTLPQFLASVTTSNRPDLLGYDTVYVCKDCNDQPLDAHHCFVIGTETRPKYKGMKIYFCRAKDEGEHGI